MTGKLSPSRKREGAGGGRAAQSVWLVSRRFDLAIFLCPAVVALALVPLAPWLAPDGDTPLPLWVIAVLLVDVAHVWATIYRTYLDCSELARRPRLYVFAPVLSYLALFVLASSSHARFWTALAYLAVFHFVRQQFGWVALYNRRDPGAQPIDRAIDTAAIYASTLFPIVWWHAHLPRRFDWFLPGDFIAGLPTWIADALLPLYIASLSLFAVRQIQRWRAERACRTGKIVVVTTTALCWGVGIIVTDSDYAFTVTNVLIHGVPYFGIVWIYGRRERGRYPARSLLAWIFGRGRLVPFYCLVAALAYLEELGWDRAVWHGMPTFFPGPELQLSELQIALVMSLLALPQVTHYVLDGFIWRTAERKNPSLGRAILGSAAGG